MQPFIVQFDWSVCSLGYEVSTGASWDVFKSMAQPTKSPDGTYIAPNAPDTLYVRPKSTSKADHRPIRPLDIAPSLYASFANLRETPDACVWFAERYGPLYAAANRMRDLDGRGESVDYWYDAMRAMKALMRGARSDDYSADAPLEIGSLHVDLVRSPDMRQPQLVVAPANLVDAMRLQLAQSIASGTTVRTCEQCGTLFPVGAMGRRRDARFCGDTCRTLFHNAKRREKPE